MEKPIIQIRNLGKEFKTANGPVRALNDINLDINQGEIFGIIGLSGAGKSTLVRCINYLEVPTEGEVLFEGQSLSAMSGAELRKASLTCWHREMSLEMSVFQWSWQVCQRGKPESVRWSC